MSASGYTPTLAHGTKCQMPLKLRVISDHHKVLGPQRSRLFGVTGGTIGRAPDNDWVLPDTNHFISGRHATVTFSAGAWLIEDTSRNGVYLNGSETPLSETGPAILTDGDRLRIGEYEVLVTIDDNSDFSPDASGQIPIPAALRAPAAARQSRAQLAPARQSAARPEPLVAEVKLESFLKPDLETTDLLVPAKRAPAKSDASNSASIRLHADAFDGVDEAVADFCRGLGVDPNALPRRSQAALFTTAGYLLRETALQLARTLRHQAQSAEADASSGASNAESDNPLLTSPSFESTVYRLFEAPGQDRLSGVDALRDAFEQIRDHDDAIEGAIATAVDELLSRIDPARLATRVDQTSTASPFGGNKKAKYWDLYSDVFSAIEQRDERGWPTLLAREFAKALTARLRERR